MHRIKKLAAVTSLALTLGGLSAPLAAADTTPGTPIVPSLNGAAWGSPGILSGNVIQLPIAIPVNACGDNVGLLGALGLSSGTVCSNG